LTRWEIVARWAEEVGLPDFEEVITVSSKTAVGL
jgi:hypothetical protein